MGIAMFFKRKEAFEEIFLYYLLINIYAAMMSNAIHFRSFIHRFRSEGKGWDPIRQVHHSKEAPVCLVIAASLLLAWESYCSVCRTAAEESSRPTSISSVTVAKCVWHDPTQLLIWKKIKVVNFKKSYFSPKDWPLIG